MGHVDVVEEFFEQEWACDSRILVNQKGQNIFHVAAKNGRHNVLNYLLKNNKLKHMDLILNERDKNGDTPLHLASKNLFPKTIYSLAKDNRVSKNIFNHEGLFAGDLVHSQSGIPVTFRQNLSNLVLANAGGRTTEKGKNMYVKPKLSVPPQVEQMKDKVNTLMLVAILIATVTFAAGFTVPGGVNPNGMAVLDMKPGFRNYVVLNTLSMYFSTFGVFLLLWAQLSDYYLTLKIFKCALVAVGLALALMTLSFLLGVRAVLTNEESLANRVAAIGSIFYLLIVWMLVSCFPLLAFDYYRLPKTIPRLAIWFGVLLSGSYPKMKNKKLSLKVVLNSQHIQSQ